MDSTEFLETLTSDQRKAFDKELRQIMENVVSSGKLVPGETHEVNVNMPLQNEALLNVTLKFVFSKGNIKGSIEDTKKFDSIEDYHERMNKAIEDGEGFFRTDP